MRSNIITSSIANAITRFAVQAVSMLRGNLALQHQWHLNLDAGSLSSRDLGTDLLFRGMTLATAGISGSYLPNSERSLKQPSNVVSNRQLFQRLS